MLPNERILPFPRQPIFEPPGGLQSADGGGTSGGMEARVAKLEAQVENIGANIADLKTDIREIKADAKTDFRLLFGAIIAAALGLAGLMAKGFHWI